MAGAIELTKFFILIQSALIWFGLSLIVNMCLFDSVVTHAYFMIGLWAIS
jgi:hypothetical protein